MKDRRSRVIASLVRLMKRDDGWTKLYPGSDVQLFLFRQTISRMSRKERRRAEDELLLDLATLMIDGAVKGGLTYTRLESDLAEMKRLMDERVGR